MKIKQRLFTAVYRQTNGQTERQNSTIEAYLRAFVYYKQNNQVKLLSIAEFAYNNTKNVSTSHTPFKLNCSYNPCVSYKKGINLGFKSKSANELLIELQKLMTVYKKNFYHAQKL